MSTKPPKRPRDPNQLAKLVIDLATGAAQDAQAPSGTAIVKTLVPKKKQEPVKAGGSHGTANDRVDVDGEATDGSGHDRQTQ